MQKLFNFRPLLLIVFSMGLFMWSCSKDATSDKDVSLETRSLPGDGGGGGGPGSWTTDYDCDKVIHVDMAKVISKYFEAQNVRQAFDQFRKAKGSEVVLLADFVYNKVLNNAALTSALGSTLTTVSNSNLCDFVNVYLTQYPGIEISFLIDVDAEYPDIINISGVETVSAYRNCPNYPIYKNGQSTTNFYTVDNSPANKIILKLQVSDVYAVYKMGNSTSATQVVTNTLITQTNANSQFSDLLRCVHVANYINNLSNVTASTKTVNGCVVTNPLTNVKIVVVDNIYNEWNKECGVPDGFPTAGNSGGGSDTLIETRTVCNSPRDAMRNGKEVFRDLRNSGGRSMLRLCNNWCNGWKRCVVQVDVFIPTVKNETEFAVLGTLQKVFSVNEKRLRKGWFNKEEVPITEWLYLEGRHGDEWQYTLTGRHPLIGNTVETTVNMAFGSKVGFTIKGVGVELNSSSSINNKIIIKFNDCPLGSEIARYCSQFTTPLIFGSFSAQAWEK